MSAPAAQTSTSTRPWFCPSVWLKPYLTPYYIVIAVVLGAITGVFAALTGVLLLIATNFNLLGLIE